MISFFAQLVIDGKPGRSAGDTCDPIQFVGRERPLRGWYFGALKPPPMPELYAGHGRSAPRSRMGPNGRWCLRTWAVPAYFAAAGLVLSST
jgi:hypothetical protein